MSMPTGSEVVAVAKVIQIAQQQGWLDKLRDFFKEKHPVLLLGSTGVGKTNFLQSLQTYIPSAIERFNRTELSDRVKVKIDNEVFDFLDTPGQIGKSEIRREAIRGALGTPNLGVINVCCDGYHEYATGVAEAIKDGQPNPDWLKRHREIEIEAAREWAPIMGGVPKYFFTVVNKCDLWWPDHDRVISHYESGGYNALLKDNDIMNRSVFAYSSVRHAFYETQTTNGIEDATKIGLQQRLLASLLRAAVPG